MRPGAQLGITTAPPDPVHGWAVWILPQIEQENLYRLYDRNKDWRDMANRPVIKTHVKTFQCPAAPNSNRIDTFTSSPYGTIETARRLWREQCHQPDLRAAPYAPPNNLIDDLGPAGSNYHGVMRVNQFQRIADITDGTSNTIYICEDAGRPFRYEKGR